ncbi:MAG: prolipoprotein diacylglyceryl transferase [Ruminococcaceae bacterium]|nr:prolipoprotein diacylglyceryl transferase [Oscillospiraceae bacterium]
MDNVAFTIFGRDVAWYGILITVGMILAIVCGLRLAKIEGIKSDDLIDLALCVIICGVIGARAYYVIFTWDEYDYLVTNKSFFVNVYKTIYNCIAVWEGGLAIYGGIIAGLVSSYVFARIKKIKFLKIFDILAACVLIGQIIGRWGNFINVEAYGAETTLPWRMGILYGADGVWYMEQYVHPTFLYESMWNLIGLIIILSIYKKKKTDGQIFCCYLIWYGFGRMLIEGLRTDSLMIGSLRVSQLVGAASLLVGVVLMIVFLKKAKISKAEDVEYVPIYESVSEQENKNAADEETESEAKTNKFQED